MSSSSSAPLFSLPGLQRGYERMSRSGEFARSEVDVDSPVESHTSPLNIQGLANMVTHPFRSGARPCSC